MQVRKFLIKLLLVPLAVAASGAQDAPNSMKEEAIFAILDPEGVVIGGQAEVYESWEMDSASYRTRFLSFTIDGHDPVISTVQIAITHTPDGRPKSFEAKYSNGQASALYAVEFEGETAIITRNPEEENRRTTQILPPGLKIVDDGAIIPRTEGPFLSFDPTIGRFVVRSNTWVEQDAGARFAGELRVTYADSFPVDAWVIDRDDVGEVSAATHPQPGSPFRYERVRSAPDIDRGGRISHPLVPSPYTIGSSARQGHIRYRLGLPNELAKHLPENAQQAVTLTEDAVRVDVCNTCGPGLPSDPETLARWTAPTRWLQSDYEPIAQRGKKMAKRKLSDRRKLELLGRVVRSRLDRLDHNGHYSARAAWERGAGDCTEDAVLLAALARATGIPTLVVSGIAYTRERYHGARNAFIPHAWVVAYVDGEWISYDMTLEEGFGAAHLGLTMGEGQPGMMVASNMMAGLIEWRGISEIRPRPEE